VPQLPAAALQSTAALPAPISTSSSPRQGRPAKQDIPAPAAAAQAAGHARRPTTAHEQLSSWDLAVQQQQSAEGSLQIRQSNGSVGAVSSTAGSSRASSLRGSTEAPAAAAQPAGRKQAFLSRFQPMGHAALQPTGPPAPAQGTRPPSVNENLREGAAGLHRQPSGEGWHQQVSHQLGGKTSAELAGGLAASAAQGRQPVKRTSEPLYKGVASSGALLDTTNAGGESYLRRLAQQRVQQAYRPPSQLH
jgi:hypothetical protein